MRRYHIHSIIDTFQGEGVFAGRRAVFVRFCFCNVWNGEEEKRSLSVVNSACAAICDTEFAKPNPDMNGGLFTAQDLAYRVNQIGEFSKIADEDRLVVYTGGEPALQLDNALTSLMWKANASKQNVETNGSKMFPMAYIDHVCLSPKPPMPVRMKGHEIKVLFPIFNPLDFELAVHEGGAKWVQPVDGPDFRKNLDLAMAFVRKHPHWRLSAQQHKLWGIP